jgi:hypothetical protein
MSTSVPFVLPQHVSRWLRLDLPGRLERLTGRSVRHVIASELTQALRGI